MTAPMVVGDATWVTWNTTINNMATAVATWNQTWVQWNNAVTTAATAIGNAFPSYTTTNHVPTYTFPPRPVLTPEQQEDARQRDREHRERIRQAARDAQRADEIAKELLMANLNERQRADYTEHDYFEVINRSGRRWRINCGHYTGNVDLMHPDQEIRLATYCAHSVDSIPMLDHFLIQKLILECAEQDFIAVANVSNKRADFLDLIPDRRTERQEPRRVGIAA